MERGRLDSTRTGEEPIASGCEHCNEPSGTVICGELLPSPSDWPDVAVCGIYQNMG
jgi:hypothetical protein